MGRFHTVCCGFVLAVLTAVIGCGGGQTTDPKEALKSQANGMLQAMKQLGDAVNSNVSPIEISGSIEGLIANSFSVKDNPEEAKQIVEIYNTKVKGKLKGDNATTVKSIVDGLEKQLRS